MWTECNFNIKHRIAEGNGKFFARAPQSSRLFTIAITENCTSQADRARYITTILNHFKYAI